MFPMSIPTHKYLFDSVVRDNLSQSCQFNSIKLGCYEWILYIRLVQNMSWFILAGYNFICKLCGRTNSQLALMIEVSHVLKILCIFNIEDNMTQLLLSKFVWSCHRRLIERQNFHSLSIFATSPSCNLNIRPMSIPEHYLLPYMIHCL